MMNIIHSKTIYGSINTYIGNVHTALNEFNELLPPAASDPAEKVKERKQRSTFFMLLALYGLPPECSSIRDQILASDVPDMDIATSILLRVPSKYSTEPSGTPSPGDTADLGSLSNNQNHSRGGSSKTRPKCEHCNRFRHKIDRCWKLHGKPQVNMAQVDSPFDNIQAAS